MARQRRAMSGRFRVRLGKDLTMRKPVSVCRDTRALAFWRAIDSELRAFGERAPGFAEVSMLYACGYSVPQALRALAPNYRPALRVVSNF